MRDCDCTTPAPYENHRDRVYVCLHCGRRIRSHYELASFMSTGELIRWMQRRQYSHASVRGSIQF